MMAIVFAMSKQLLHVNRAVDRKANANEITRALNRHVA